MKMKPSSNRAIHLLCIIFILTCSLSAHVQSTFSELPLADVKGIESRVYTWDDWTAKETEIGQTRPILEGSTTHLEYLEMDAITLDPNKAGAPEVHSDLEELIIIKEGQLAITIENDRKVLGPGSMALILPGDTHGINNIGDTPATYYVLKYRSKLPMDLVRGKQVGGSFMVDWNEVTFNEHDKGGRRDFFDRPTAMCEDFEMHVTNLNEKTPSHSPHTHLVEEIVLMVKGNVAMHIDGSEQSASVGDLSFLDSNIPHAATNTGVGQCIYFAFQWK